MWEERKRKRYSELREPGRHLNDSETSELAALMRELEEAEATVLKPATDRIREENDRRENRIREIDGLVKRKDALVHRLEIVLAEAQAEERAIERELAAALAGENSADSDE
jgi:hypothetical protein